MGSNCVLCETKFQTTYLDEINEKHLRAAAIWYQLEKVEDGRTEKNENKGTFENLLSTLKTACKVFAALLY